MYVSLDVLLCKCLCSMVLQAYMSGCASTWMIQVIDTKRIESQAFMVFRGTPDGTKVEATSIVYIIQISPSISRSDRWLGVPPSHRGVSLGDNRRENPKGRSLSYPQRVTVQAATGERLHKKEPSENDGPRIRQNHHTCQQV